MRESIAVGDVQGEHEVAASREGAGSQQKGDGELAPTGTRRRVQSAVDEVSRADWSCTREYR
jgi:hypothetical protein